MNHEQTWGSGTVQWEEDERVSEGLLHMQAIPEEPDKPIWWCKFSHMPLCQMNCDRGMGNEA